MGAPWEKYQQESAAPEGPWSKYKAGPSPAEEPRQVNYQDATDDPNWIKNARTLYKEVNKADPKDDYEATTFLKDYLYDFNYRLAGSDKVGLRNTFGVASDVGSFSPEGKKAFLDAQQQFENFDVTLPGVLEAGERVLTDPTSYLGLGGGAVVKQGVKEGVKQGVKAGLKRTAQTAAVGAAEGAAYSGASNLGQQTARINADGQEAYNLQELGTSAGIGAGVGGVAGGVIGGAIEAPQMARAANRLPVDNEQAATGLAQRLDGLTKGGDKLDLKNVDRNAPDGAEAALSKAHTQISEEIKADTSAVKSMLDDNDFQSLTKVNSGLRSAKNKVKDFITDDEIATIETKVGNTLEGRRLVNNLRQSNELFNLQRRGVKGGISQYTDELNPIGGGSRYLGDGAKAIRALGTLANYGTGGFPGLGAQAAGFLGGRAIDALTGRRAPVNLFVRQNLKGAVDDLTGLESVRAKVKQTVDAQKALMKDVSAKLEREAIDRNEVPSGGKYNYAHLKTGLKPQEVLRGMSLLEEQGLLPPEIRKIFDTDPHKLKQGNVLNKIIDRLNSMADQGVLPRDPKWSPNSGDDVMRRGIDEIRYAEGVKQNQRMEAEAMSTPVDPRSQEIVRDAVLSMQAAGRNQKLRMSIFETALSRTSTPEERKQVARALTPLKELYKKKYRANRRGD